MGMDATCDIAYGFVVERYDLPWRSNDGDIDQWWRVTRGYEAPFELFDAAGQWLPDMQNNKEKRDEYYHHRDEWMKANPCPIGEVTGSEGEDCVIITSSEISDICFDWDYGIQPLDPKRLEVSAAQLESVEKVRALLQQEGIEIKDGPGWFAVCDFS